MRSTVYVRNNFRPIGISSGLYLCCSNIYILEPAIEKKVFGAYTDSEGPDQTVQCLPCPVTESLDTAEQNDV